MQVYELMAALSEMPSGAEVRYDSILTVNELRNKPKMDDDHGDDTCYRKTFGCKPYVMRFEKVYESEYSSFYATVAAWCNQPSMFNSMSFRLFSKLRGIKKEDYKKYKRDIEGYMQDVGRKGSAWLSMEMIENRFPEIAERYFDFVGKSPSKYEWLDILLRED